MSSVIFSDHGDSFLRPIPYPERPNRSPTVTKVQSMEASYSSLELSHMNA